MGGVAHFAALATIALVLLAVAQPIFSDDVWWHLALGAAYAKSGPWLDFDPLAFTTLGPPDPTSWLADLSLHGVRSLAGFTGLRLFHFALIVMILGLAWSILHRASRSATAASVMTAVFAATTAYRLVQLRPHLFSILAMLLLYWLLLQGRVAPSWWRVGLSALLMGLWANMHPVYPLGPVFVAAAAAGLWVASSLASDVGREQIRHRAFRIFVALLLGVVATCLHPMGIEGYLKAFSVGSGSESLAVVVDEWSAFEPFVWPVKSSPPSVLTWIVTWCLILTTTLAALRACASLLRWRGFELNGEEAPDPALIPLALAGLLAMLSASRFSWLSLFPLCLVVSASGIRFAKPAAMFTLGALALSLPLGFMRYGDWPMITRGLPPTPSGFRVPYASGKYHLPAVWFLRDARLEGNLFGRYSEGGFQAFWLGPAIRTAMNGALNMPQDSLDVSFSLRERIGTPRNPRFEDALDAMGVDLFVGTGLPMESRPGRPPNYSTNYLENVPGWILAFRNLDSAVYLRLNEKNRENLEKVAAYYASAEIPFDATRGFRPIEVMRRVPGWAHAMGISTPLLKVVSPTGLDARQVGLISSTYLALGLYAEASAVNDVLLESNPSDPRALERRLWLQLRPGQTLNRLRLERSIRALSGGPRSSLVARDLIELGRAVASGEAVSQARLRRVSIFSRTDARALLRSKAAPEVRWD